MEYNNTAMLEDLVGIAKLEYGRMQKSLSERRAAIGRTEVKEALILRGESPMLPTLAKYDPQSIVRNYLSTHPGTAAVPERASQMEKYVQELFEHFEEQKGKDYTGNSVMLSLGGLTTGAVLSAILGSFASFAFLGPAGVAGGIYLGLSLKKKGETNPINSAVEKYTKILDRIDAGHFDGHVVSVARVLETASKALESGEPNTVAKAQEEIAACLTEYYPGTSQEISTQLRLVESKK